MCNRFYSAAIIRAATATELAANFVIRQELQVRMGVEAQFVNHLLRWANGMQGKLDKLILPICKGTDKYEAFVSLKEKVTRVNDERNSIVHSGQFKKKGTTMIVLTGAKEIIEVLVNKYNPGFSLTDIE